MTLKTKIVLVVLFGTLMFAVGRFTVPTKTVTVTKTVEVEKKVENTDAQEHKVTIITKKPDGTETTVITDQKDSQTKETTTEVSKTDTEKSVTKDGSRTTIAALAGVTFSNLQAPVYGLSVSRTLLGPISIGAFGFTSGFGGISVGLTF